MQGALPTSWLSRMMHAAPALAAPTEPALAGVARRVSPRRILALCLGGIGDTVLALAALRDLRKSCPGDAITVLTMWPQAAELIRDLGLFDEVLQHNFQRDRWHRSLHMAMQLRMRHFDDSLLFFPANRHEYNGLSWLIGAQRRWGHTYLRGGDIENLRFLLTDRIPQRSGRHTIDENRELVAAFSGHSVDTPADIQLAPLAPIHMERAAWLLRHLERPLLGIHPGCTTYKGHAARRWPADRFGQLCERALDEMGLQPVVFGALDEAPLKFEIQAICPRIFMAHGSSIRDTAAQIARCAVFVSNDSGLAHIASAVGVPVVMVCGPTDEGTIAPRGPLGRVVSARLPCSPCFQVGRKPVVCTNPTFQACLKAVSVDAVAAAVAECLRESTNRQPSPAVAAGTYALPVLRASA